MKDSTQASCIRRVCEIPQGSRKADGREAKSPTRTSVLPELSEDDRAFVQNAVERVVLTLKMYGFDSEGYKLSGSLAHWYQCAAETGCVVKFIKWKLAMYYASSLSRITGEQQDLETPPFTTKDREDILLGGRAYRFLRNMEVKKPELFKSWLTSTMFLKKGCPRPSDKFLDLTVDKAYKLLTTKVKAPISLMDDVDWCDADAEDENIFLLADALTKPEMRKHRTRKEANDHRVAFIRSNLRMTDRFDFRSEMTRTVKEILHKREYTELDRIKPFFPSTSANYILSRGRGGAVGVVLKEFKELLQSGGSEAKVFIDTVTNGDDVTPSPHLEVNLGRLQNEFAILYESIVHKALEERPVSELLGLKEALKVRVISKGPPLIYTALKPLQKFLWSAVKGNISGRLVGEPVSASYIQEILGKKLGDDQRLLSVDYSDATNRMYGWVSQFLVEILSDEMKLTNTERLLFRKGLTEHVIRHPVTLQELPQERGQLMGSVVSFPLLCIVNMTLLRMTKEFETGRTLTLAQAGISVNGDDGILRTTSAGKRFWERLSSFVGLEPSQGKVYFSTKYVNMNSRNFERLDVPDMVNVQDEKGVNILDDEMQPVLKPLYYRQVPFVNLGLYLGMERSSGGSANSASSLQTVTTRCVELVNVLPEDLKKDVLSMYIRHHMVELKKLNVPFFLPAYLGGAGLPYIKGTDMVPSHSDLILGRLFLQLSQGEIDLKISIPHMPKTTEWMMWERATLVAKKRGFDLTEEGMLKQQTSISSVETSDKLVSAQTIASYLVVEQLFSVRGLKDLLKEEKSKTKEDVIERYYGKLSICLNRLRSNKVFPMSSILPLDIDHLPNQRPSLSDVNLYPVLFARRLDTTSTMNTPNIIIDSRTDVDEEKSTVSA